MNDLFVKCLFELIGPAVLVLFVDGVVASTCLNQPKRELGR